VALADETRGQSRGVMLFVILTTFVCLSSTLSVILLREVAAERDELARLVAEGRACDADTGVGASGPPAASAAPESQPRSDTPYIPIGTDIQPAMRLMLERVATSERDAPRVRLGAKEVLPPTSVHVVTLWAPWCEPCKHLLPRLRDMFQRRQSDWQASVDFIPIQVNDDTSPERSYARFGPLMPRSEARLADRSENRDLLEILRAPSQALHRGDLPLTFLLDCNRRVRWAKEGSFTPATEEDFERWIDHFVEQLRRGDLECKRRWCGNGRCDPGEQSRCEDDCGPFTPAPPPAACPSDCLQCDDKGRCLVRVTGPARCGDGRCEKGESNATCCNDCCEPPFVCQENEQKRQVCKPAPMKF
jgi:thiol-disulfide isomerase/thioredoxin